MAKRGVEMGTKPRKQSHGTTPRVRCVFCVCEWLLKRRSPGGLAVGRDLSALTNTWNTWVSAPVEILVWIFSIYPEI